MIAAANSASVVELHQRRKTTDERYGRRLVVTAAELLVALLEACSSTRSPYRTTLHPHRAGLLQRVRVRLDELLGRPGEPRFDDHLVQVVEADPVEAHQDRRVAVEVRSGEESRGVVGDQRLLCSQMLDTGTEDRPEYRCPMRALSLFFISGVPAGGIP